MPAYLNSDKNIQHKHKLDVVSTQRTKNVSIVNCTLSLTVTKTYDINIGMKLCLHTQKNRKRRNHELHSNLNSDKNVLH